MNEQIPSPSPPLTLAVASKAIGKSATWKTSNGIKVPVTIVDIRSAYGRIEFDIRPKGGAGDGTAWVSPSSLEIDTTN